MNSFNSNRLESLLIAEEGFGKLDDDAKAAFLSLLLTSGLIGIFGGLAAYKQRKVEKKQAATLHANDNKKKDEFVKFNNQYHFENMSETEYDKYIQSVIANADKDVKAIVKAANKNKEYINSCKEKYIRNYKDKVDKSLLPEFKPGMFYSDFDEEGYWIIMDSQEMADACDFHYEIADTLRMKYSNPIINFDNGEGDEGCVYIDYPTYNGLQRILKKNNIIR